MIFTGSGTRGNPDAISRRVYSGAGQLIPQSFFGIHSSRWPRGNPFTFTASGGSDTLTVTHSGRGDVEFGINTFTSTGTLPAPLQAGVDYYNIPTGVGTTAKVSLASGGTPITMTDAGTGTHTIHFESPAPTYGYGHFRSWDAVRWAQIHTADETYDSTFLDAVLVPHIARGAVINWCVAGVPTWASSNPGGSGLYNLGDRYVPINVDSPTGPFKEFLTWLLTRYNKASGGLYGSDATRIGVVEVWNEANNTNSWMGTTGEMAQIGKSVRNVVDAVDPAVVVISPGWAANFGGSTTIDSYMTASDGAGGVLRDHLDGFAWHPYTYGFDATDQTLMALSKWAQDIATTHSLTGLYATEWGDFPNASGQQVYTTQKRAALMRTISLQAMLGWKMSTIYGHDNRVAFLCPCVDATIAQMFDEFFTKVCGKTMLTGDVLLDGRCRMTFNDGTTYTSPAF